MIKKIGVFDSGCGGLSVVQTLAQQNTSGTVVFYADTDNAPYGDKSVSELHAINQTILDFFKSQKVDTIIMGCNTSTALFLEPFQQKYTQNFLGLVQPACESAIELSKSKKIAVLATHRTVESGVFSNTLKQLSSNVNVTEVSCPGLVEHIENGTIQSQACRELCREYMARIKGQGIDTLILGCTHYPMLVPIFQSLVPEPIQYIDPAKCLRYPKLEGTDPFQLEVVISGPSKIVEHHIKCLNIPYSISIASNI